jgi:hypothetical protein
MLVQVVLKALDFLPAGLCKLFPELLEVRFRVVLGLGEFFLELKLDVQQLVDDSGVKFLKMLVGNVVDSVDLVGVLRVYFLLWIVLVFGPISLILLSYGVLGATLEVK